MGDGMESVDLPTPALIKPIELWTGKQLFSVLIRPHAHMKVFVNLTVLEKNYSKSGGTMCPNDGFVYFRNSELVCGQLGKATLGNGNKDGLFSVLLRDYNAHAAASCMNRLAKLSARWIGNHGFSIGIDDVEPGGLLNHKKKARMDEGYEKCDNLIKDYNEGKLELPPGCDSAQALEAQITEVLSKIRETTANSDDCVCWPTNSWRSAYPNGFIDRSLPHFPRKPKTHSAKGFVANSFYSGLTATEFFFHTMGGREGLVDTAVKTADTGYMSRRLIKALEDLSVQYDYTVRNTSGGVVQFLYGDDGMDPAKMEGENGVPLNLERLYMKIKATCPARRHENLSPSEAKKEVYERLSKPDTTHCSNKFKNPLLGFFDELSKPDTTIARINSRIHCWGSLMKNVMRRTILVLLRRMMERYLELQLELLELKALENQELR
ncbi:hypothetical protein IFM89_002416 [Coptis chinensis]|uniref:DNA-directed RNA polymerase n=1 Tax=Coptis chinensis TaxID=261450 RepID=A0A835IIY4_9MAGN|nr:hypothetical protein IFM89_002416 [Coptis chinensis]